MGGEPTGIGMGWVGRKRLKRRARQVISGPRRRRRCPLRRGDQGMAGPVPVRTYRTGVGEGGRERLMKSGKERVLEMGWERVRGKEARGGEGVAPAQ